MRIENRWGDYSALFPPAWHLIIGNHFRISIWYDWLSSSSSSFSVCLEFLIVIGYALPNIWTHDFFPTYGRQFDSIDNGNFHLCASRWWWWLPVDYNFTCRYSLSISLSISVLLIFVLTSPSSSARRRCATGLFGRFRCLHCYHYFPFISLLSFIVIIITKMIKMIDWIATVWRTEIGRTCAYTDQRLSE